MLCSTMARPWYPPRRLEDGGIRGSGTPALFLFAPLGDAKWRDPGESGGGVRGFGERTDEVPTGAGVQANPLRVARVVTELRTNWSEGGSFERVAGSWCCWCPLLDECSGGPGGASDLRERAPIGGARVSIRFRARSSLAET